MDNQKLLSEERYQQNNAKVKKTGKILLIIGIVALIIGVIFIVAGVMSAGSTVSDAFDSAGNSINDRIDLYDQGTIGVQNTFETTNDTAKEIFGGFGLVAVGIFLNSIAFLLIIVGGVLMFIGHRREITAYTTQQVMPVAQEGIEKMTPTVADAAGSIAKSISKGIKEGKAESVDNK